MKIITPLIAATLAFHMNAFAAGEGWTSDFAAAKKQAAEAGHDLLVDFTGSDWCGWCIKLNEEVFQHEPFKDGVKDKFVLVELDFPRDKEKISAEVAEQNALLQEKYGVRGFPTILLTDAEGRPYARTGYRPGGPADYVAHLDELRGAREARDEALAKAAAAEGPEKAKALVAALNTLSLDDAMITNFYAAEVKAIQESDPEDTTGYAKRLERKARFAKFEEDLGDLGRRQDLEGALVLVSKTVEAGGLEQEDMQKVVLTRASILAQQGQFDEAIATVDEAHKLAPESEIAPMLDGFKQRLAAGKAERDAQKPAEE
jgi:thioredoxin-related protein